MKQARPLVLWIAVAALVMILSPLAAVAAPALQDSTPTPTPPAPAATSGDDWSRVQQAGKLVVGTAADYVPYAFYNSQFQLDGFDIKLAEALGQELGVTVEFNDFAFDGLLNALNLGQVDMAIGAISVTPERQQLVDFSNVYYISNDAALMRTANLASISTAADLAGRKVGVEQGTTFQTWVERNAVDTGIIPAENLTTYIDTTSMVRDLRNGTIDVAIMGLLPAQDTTQRFPDVAIAGTGYNTEQLAIAAPKGSTLLEPLNAALLTLQGNGTYSKLVATYLQGGSPSQDNAARPTEVPTLPPPATPTATPANVAAPTPTPLPAPVNTACVDGMAFIQDVSFDDQNMTAPPVFQPNTPFVKIWRLQNAGTCTWTTGYALAFVSGNQPGADMGGTYVPIDQNVAPGATVDIAASLRAPANYGTYQGFWKMRNAQGQYFGEVVWVGITVPNPNPAPPPPTPIPPPVNNPTPNLRADANPITAGQCTTIRWDIDGVQAVYFIAGGNQQGVAGHDARNVCPGGTTTYTLRVVYTNNTSQDFPITINVVGAPSYSINFWADSDVIRKGECTTLRWNVSGVQAVYYQGNGVPGQGAQQECPRSNTTYRLTVIKVDGGQEVRDVTVQVKDSGGSGPPPPGPIVPM